MWLLALLFFLVSIACIFILSEKWKESKFRSKGILYMGNGLVRLTTNTLRGIGVHDYMARLHRHLKSKGFKLALFDDFGQMTLLVEDPVLIKSMLVKDFDKFFDRRPTFATGKGDYLFTKMLFAMTGDAWRQLRTKLSPIFTTGKIKRMFHLFDQSGQKFVQFLTTEIQEAATGEVELSDAYSKYTMDIIASAACGIDSKAFNQKESSLFETMAKSLQFQIGVGMMLKIIAMIFLPTKICDALGLSLFRKDAQDFFSGAVKSSIKQPEWKGQKRNDFVQLMLEARAGTIKLDENELETFEKDAILKEGGKGAIRHLLDDDGIVANCVFFMLAGFDTTQSLLHFCTYVLAIHQDVQEKLREEINSILEENDGTFTYDGLNEMRYLDMVVNETLRFYPPVTGTERACNSEYKIPGTDFVLKKGNIVTIPVYGLHHDPEFFPEPEKFDLERFSAENKSSINPYVFLPFGQGPRNCIGMRFGLTEAKLVIAHLVHNFKLEPSEKTLIPMRFSKATTLKPEGGIQLRLTKM